MFDARDDDDIQVLTLLTDMAKLGEQDIAQIVLRAYWLGQGEMPLEDVLNFAPIGISEKPKACHLTLVKK